MTSYIKILKRRTRVLLFLFTLGLLLSGITAFPLKAEVDLLQKFVGQGTFIESHFPALSQWISKVHVGIIHADKEYPFLFYGTDWLAFGHIVIAIAFIGPLIDPVKNIWVITFGMISCILVLPLAFICGPIRGIPFFWQLIDCSFGIFGIIPLFVARRYTKRIIKIDIS